MRIRSRGESGATRAQTVVVSERELETFGGPERRGDLGSITESPGKHRNSREEKCFHGMFQQQGLNQPCRDFPQIRMALKNKTHLLLPRVAGD